MKESILIFLVTWILGTLCGVIVSWFHRRRVHKNQSEILRLNPGLFSSVWKK